MRKIGICALLFSVLCSCFSCTHPVKEREPNCSDNQKEMQSVRKDTFPYPKIPAVIVDAREKKKYLLAHYWDEYTFPDATLVNKDIPEQAFVNYIFLLGDESLTKQQKEESLQSFCIKFIGQKPLIQERFMNMFDNYLYNSNSPYYNEELYAVYLRCMLQTSIDEARKSTFQFLLSLINRNNPGEIATDFPYYLPNGKSQTLRSTLVSGNYLLLIFYDPECQNCHQIMQQMIQNRYLNSLSENGLLTVLAVYTEGNKDVWKQSLQEMPDSWIVGEDRQTIKDNALYDLKAMPSMYLLNKKKEVLLKDASYAQLMQVLQ